MWTEGYDIIMYPSSSALTFYTILLSQIYLSLILYTWTYRVTLCYFLTTNTVILHKGIHTEMNIFRMKEIFQITSSNFCPLP